MSEHEYKKPWRRRPIGLWLVIASGLGVVVFLTIRSVVSDNDSSAIVQRPKNGTHLAEVLPDYVTTLNEQLRQDVDPTSNAEAALRRILGPDGIPEPIRERYYQLLGMSLPDEQAGQFFQSFNEFVKGLRHIRHSLTPDLDVAVHEPWTESQYPEIAEWLQKNEQHLNEAVSATKLSQMYVPLVFDDRTKQGPQFLNLLIPATSQHRELADALIARAMLRLGQAKTQEAWDDLQACHRLARHMSKGGTLLEGRNAATVESRACQADRQVAARGHLTAEEARAFEAELRNLEPLPGPARYLDKSERHKFSDAARIAKEKGFAALDKFLGHNSREIEGLERLLFASVDFEEVLRAGDEFYDKVIDAAAAPTSAERVLRINALKAEVFELKVHGVLNLGGGNKRKHIAQVAASEVLSRILPKIEQEFRATDAAAAERDLSRLDLLLRAYYADHGDYPDELQALVPDYISEVPIDPFSGKPYVYNRQGDTVRLYSVGDGLYVELTTSSA